MKQYEKYKETGIEWIDEIPSNWDFKKIKYSATINDETLPETTDENYEINYVDISSIDKGKIASQEIYRFIDAPSRARRKVKHGDVIVSTVRTYLKAIARIKKPEPNLIVSTGFAVVRPIELHPDYLGNLVLSEYFIGEIISRSVGVSYPSINSSEIGEIKIPIPPQSEQTAIANYLDEKTTQIDKLISNKQKLIELLIEERTSFINEAVSGKGKNWESKKLKFVAKKVQTGSTPPSNEEQYYVEEINWFTPSDFSEKLFLQNSKRKIAELAVIDGVVKRFPENSVLFVGIGATLGKVGYIIEPSTSNQQINCLSFRSKEEAIFYANYFYSNQPNIVALANAATLPILNQSQMKDIMLPIPSSVDELKTTIQYIQNETQRIDNTISKVENEIELMQEYKTALISEVVTGKIKVI